MHSGILKNWNKKIDMKKFGFVIALICLAFGLNAQTVEGQWYTVDEDTGERSSIIEISEVDGELQGKIIKSLKNENPICTKCDGDKKDQPMIGMVIMYDFEKKNDAEWVDGKILDPQTGKVYNSKLKAKGKNRLDVRGYIGVSLFGKTQQWERVE